MLPNKKTWMAGTGPAMTDEILIVLIKPENDLPMSR
jgi:hypothetical protein